MSLSIPRRTYADLYGPTTGDRVRLADTDLIVEVEKDFAAYGDEITFGGGKVIRDGMGQSARLTRANGALDLVITNALIIDHGGIVKGDIGIRDGRIVGVGKAGNPDTMEGVEPALVVGASTEVIAGENLIVTAGGIDSHIHFISPQQVQEALSNGITTMIGGGTGPATGTDATTCTPGAWNLARMLEAADAWPMNFGFLGKGNAGTTEPLAEQVRAGACGLKLHEDWGTTPAAIDACLRVADEFDVQVAIHTDTINEAGFVEDTIAALAGRTIHTYHTEGAGGGHAPDIIRIAALPHILPSSTNPTRPYTVNTIAEHLDMLMVCHHLNPLVPEDVAFAESRIRPETIAAEDILHDLGVFSMISSDSQAMGRVGEVVTRTWQTAHKMKTQRGALPQDSARNDNFRVRRYVAKYTINPAITHGIAQEVGSIERGKLADIVLWKPSMFGVKPEMVIKSGFIAWSVMGDANASIPTPQPVIYRPMFGSFGRATASTSITFVSQASLDAGIGSLFRKRAVAAQIEDVRVACARVLGFDPEVRLTNIGDFFASPGSETFVIPAALDFNLWERDALGQRIAEQRRNHPDTLIYHDDVDPGHSLVVDALGFQTTRVLGEIVPQKCGLILAASGQGDPGSRAQSYRLMRLLWERLGFVRAEVAFVRNIQPFLGHVLEQCAREPFPWVVVFQGQWETEHFEYAQVILDNFQRSHDAAKHWRIAPAPGAQPLLTAWYTQRITGLWKEKCARDAMRTPSAKNSVPAASFIQSCGSGTIARVSDRDSLTEVLTRILPAQNPERVLVKVTWHGYATGTYTDAAALDILLSALPAPAVILEGHTSSRNLGGAQFDWETEARENRTWIRQQEAEYLRRTGLQQVLTRHGAQYVNVTEEFWDEGSPGNPTQFVPKTLLDFRGCPMLSFAKFKGATRLGISNLFGLIPLPLRSAWHGPNITWFAHVCCDLAKSYGSVFDLCGVVEGLYSAVRWNRRGLYRSRWATMI